MITIENADKALKTYYLDAVSAQLNEGISPFFATIEKSTNNVYGKDVKMLVTAGNSGNVVAGGEDGDLPAPYSNRYYDITVPLKNVYGTIEISDKALRASQNSSGSFVNLLNAEMDGLISSAKFNFQRMLYGSGDGYLCGTTQRINGKTFKVSNTKFISAGMKVDLIDDPDILTNGENLTVTNVDTANGLVTVDKEIAEDDFLDTAGFYIHGAYGNEIAGLGAIFGFSDLYGYDRTDNPYFNPKTYYTDSEPLSEDYLLRIIDEIEERYGEKPDMILCSFATRRKIAAVMSQNKTVVDTTTLQGGYGAILFNGIPVVADRFCPENTVYVINTKDFCLHQLCDWEWLEDEDGKILKQIPGKAAYSATLVKYAELVCSKPCAQSALYIID